MANPKKGRKPKAQPAAPQVTYPQGAVQHAMKLAQDFATVYEHFENRPKRLSRTIKNDLRIRIQSVVAKGLSKRVCPSFSSDENKTSFQNMMFDMMCKSFSYTLPQDTQDKFDALDQSFRHLVPKVQALELASRHPGRHLLDSISGTAAEANADSLLSAQVARLSVDHEMLDSSYHESSDDVEERTKQAIQPAIRLQGSVDFSLDESEDGRDEESGDGSEMEIKEENDDDATATAPPDPTIFTISLGVQIAADDYRFTIKFNDERVVTGLSHMPSREIWQLVHDAIQQDHDIPNRTSSLSRIIDKIRQENAEKIPLLSHLGAIRDIVMLENPAVKKERDDHANYLLVFGSREAANAALTTGLMYRKKNRTCVVYEPNAQWHQQCSHCQGHSHTAKECQSTPLCGRCGYKHANQYCTSATIECANCRGKHGVWSKECPKWQEAEENARRLYRFPAEDPQPQVPTPAQRPAANPPPPPLPLPLPVGQNAQQTPNKNPEIAPPFPNSSKAPGKIPPATVQTSDERMPYPEIVAPAPAPAPAPHSAVLQTIDQFRAFVAAQETNTQSSRKRKASACVMTGALQDEDHDGKRAKREPEGPVWPIGQKNYRPPSLKKMRGSKR